LHPDLANPARAEILAKIRKEEAERLASMLKEIASSFYFLIKCCY